MVLHLVVDQDPSFRTRLLLLLLLLLALETALAQVGFHPRNGTNTARYYPCSSVMSALMVGGLSRTGTWGQRIRSLFSFHVRCTSPRYRWLSHLCVASSRGYLSRLHVHSITFLILELHLASSSVHE